jgi:glyoxylase-like metal-dependent hydrolase (beta-lactamase superfamily II)
MSINVATVSPPSPFDCDEEIVPGSRADADPLSGHDILCVRAPNLGPLTLTGTNTWIVGRDPAWVVDPGPLIETHVERVCGAIEDWGGLGGIVLTHDHADHAEAVPELLARYQAPLAGGRGEVDVRLEEGVRVGPFDPVLTSGHSVDHFALIAAGACFTGDAVLGEGSVFIAPHSSSMSRYMQALERLRVRGDFDVLCPGHGPLVRDAAGKLDEYMSHRSERERRLVDALEQGLRTEAELLDAAWPEVPEQLRPMAGVTLAAHLDKLEEEGLLPEGMQRFKLEGFEE